MKKIICLAFCSLLCSCASQLYIPTKSVNSVSVENLKEGRDLYANNCGSCHQLYLPNQYSEKAWGSILNKMQGRAKITDNQKQLIYQYITSEPKK